MGRAGVSHGCGRRGRAELLRRAEPLRHAELPGAACSGSWQNT